MGSAVIHYSSAAASDRGRRRSSNEDAFGLSVEIGAFLVCDGMGGAAAGEVASALAVDETMSVLKSRAPDRTLPQTAEQAVSAANRAIFQRAQRNTQLSGMGTTLVALVTSGDRAWMLNVGDSRGYLLRAGHLRQITVDHSLVEEQVRSGRMDQAEALRSPLRNVITRALGTQPTVTPDVFPLEINPGDLFLLCSDGLTRELTDDQLQSMLRIDASLEQMCGRLIESANNAGGHDNITCLLVRAEG